jgi:hypothetical protein
LPAPPQIVMAPTDTEHAPRLGATGRDAPLSHWVYALGQAALSPDQVRAGRGGADKAARGRRRRKRARDVPAAVPQPP